MTSTELHILLREENKQRKIRKSNECFYKFLNKKEQKKPRKVNISEGFRTCDEKFAELSKRSDSDGFQEFTANYVEKSNSGDVRITNELFTKENKRVYNSMTV